MLRMPLFVKSLFRKRPCGGISHVPFRDLCELRMIESVESFPSKLQFPPFSKRKGFQNGKIQIVYDACEKCIAADSRGVRQSYAFDPMNICGINADNYVRASIGIAVTGIASRGE